MSRINPVTTCVVLGSGGHTGEMLRLVGALNRNLYAPMLFMVADNDPLSVTKAKDAFGPTVHIVYITRCRQVKQPLASTFFPGIISLLQSFAEIFRMRPELILCNGPGTCIPICMAAFVMDLLLFRTCHIIYVESICRVTTLSLSARILYHSRIADHLFVQWPQLQRKYWRTVYIGRF
ncbi:Alg14 domain containing protein [Trichuris trichiura]|uniref:UDP-N-acetylglucosamine transferase subunit ALG14 n=1 Tax=Trichuris trichiura TaxID=36087 RepID=A0A077ZL25_TRITR|nr:Alg14 domain containing protein [Trichuris trichiura]